MIARDPEAAASEGHDLVIVGGGIYGVMLALESARAGARPLLVERDDFGGATSWNSLRIVHGGLRDLQKVDLVRYREMVRERSWLLRHFPEHVEPLACLMPLYGRGLRRAPVLRAALAANELLSRDKNRGLRADRMLPRGRVLGRAETEAAFPGVERAGLEGGALWFDAVMADSQRLLVEALRWACAEGACALNYVEVRELLAADGQVRGVRALDRVTGRELELSAPRVVNAAGPWSRALAARFDRDAPELFRPSLALNAFLDRPPLAEVAVAVDSPGPNGRTYFLHPWKGRLFAGTYHAPWSGEMDPAAPPEAPVQAFVDALNAALPSLELKRGDVLRVHWGYLPAAREGSDALALRPALVDHGARGGPGGLYSISGVKFTTARDVARKALRMLGLALPPDDGRPPEPRRVPVADALAARLEGDPAALRREAETLVREESVVRLDDLVLRRSDWAVDPRQAESRRDAVAALMDWQEPVGL